MTNFEMIDHPDTPRVIKPITILHDKLVKGYKENKEIKVDKLIINLEKTITQQIIQLVQIEDKHRANTMILIKCLSQLRNVADNISDEQNKEEIVNQIVEFINTQCDDLLKISDGNDDDGIDLSTLLDKADV
jgi:hypothetical protein